LSCSNYLQSDVGTTLLTIFVHCCTACDTHNSCNDIQHTLGEASRMLHLQAPHLKPRMGCSNNGNNGSDASTSCVSLTATSLHATCTLQNAGWLH
jgi:hypothetical protein